MRSKFFITAFILLPILLAAQSPVQKDSICFNNTIIDYSNDTSGNIYLSFKGGTITKLSPTLDSLYTYSPIKVGDTKLLDAGNGLYIFAFYDFFQEYVLTNRFLSSPTRTKLSDIPLDYIDIATQSQDNNIWVMETSGFRLIKYNTMLKRIESETLLTTIIESADNDFVYIKEFQNQVFLVDKNSGIYIFDNLGNFLRKVKAQTSKVNFYENYMYYLEDDQLVKKELYTNKTIRTPYVNKPIGILLHKENTYSITSTCLYRRY
ncbi:MAG: hypothetical protein L3J06_08365 [Cyclobacteriaceae bacterium]|nr:hypothetical protein [Cyclobacteriaceae bacterium]